jgi:MoaA/NifB/PqqE/SkfB family radical SAM enzyme
MKPLVVIPQYFGALVFDRRTSRYMPFDAECTALLRACHAQPWPRVLHGAHDPRRAFFEAFEAQGFFGADQRLCGTFLDAAPPPDHLLGPLAVHLEVIARCNLQCRHCFAGVLPRGDAPLSLTEMSTLFADLASIGSFRLGLTGGEPLMRRDLFDIVDAATDAGLHPCLTTNGLLITEDIARKFGERSLVWLNVSLDGATAATNDAIRGAGTYDRVLRKLRLLGEHARFTLAFTITRHNVEEVEACAALAREVGAHTAVFRPVYPAGVANENLELMPSFEAYTDALTSLSQCLAPDEAIRAIDPFSPQARQARQSQVYTNEGCGAGNLVASINVEGAVNPCSFLGPKLDAESIRTRPFSEIWSDSDVFRRFRALPKGEGHFQGGCRARSQVLAGDLNAPDPWHDAYLERSEALHPLSNIVVESSP